MDAMKTEDVLDVFHKAGAILKGHFILTSGRHSAIYMQKANVFMHARLTEKLCRAMVREIRSKVSGRIDYVVGPAVGGLILAYETSRYLGVPAIWVERENGVFRLRRFNIEKSAHTIIVDDIVTTGHSIRETVQSMYHVGAKVVAAACIIDRSGGKIDVGLPLISLAEYEIPSYNADSVPSELAALPAIRPGDHSIDMHGIQPDKKSIRSMCQI